jgi:hypothetical protein
LVSKPTSGSIPTDAADVRSYLWGPATKDSWNKGPAGYTQFAEYIVKDSFSLNRKDTVIVKLNDNNTLDLTSLRAGSPSETSRVHLLPIWQLATLSRDAKETDTPRERSSHNLKDRPIYNEPPACAKGPRPLPLPD